MAAMDEGSRRGGKYTCWQLRHASPSDPSKAIAPLHSVVVLAGARVHAPGPHLQKQGSCCVLIIGWILWKYDHAYMFLSQIIIIKRSQQLARPAVYASMVCASWSPNCKANGCCCAYNNGGPHVHAWSTHSFLLLPPQRNRNNIYYIYCRCMHILLHCARRYTNTGYDW